MWYVWILSPCSDDDCFQREIATSDRKTEGESRQTDRERPCSAPLPLPVQSISSVWLWWIMDVAIDRLAQLCSIDPLWRHTQTQFLSDINPQKEISTYFLSTVISTVTLESEKSVFILYITSDGLCLLIENHSRQVKTKLFVLFSEIMQFVSHDWPSPSWLLTSDALFCALLQHYFLLYSLLHLLLVTISSWIVVSHMLVWWCIFLTYPSLPPCIVCVSPQSTFLMWLLHLVWKRGWISVSKRQMERMQATYRVSGRKWLLAPKKEKKNRWHFRKWYAMSGIFCSVAPSSGL